MKIKTTLIYVIKRLGIYRPIHFIYQKIVLYILVPIRLWLTKPVICLLAKQVCDILEEAHFEKKKTIFLYQYTYFTRDGAKYISGGAERYISDIEKIIKKKGFRTVLFQMGNEKSAKIWSKQKDDLLVIGIPGDIYQYCCILDKLSSPVLSIYSGYVNFGRHLKHPNILISHGITWDFPGNNANIKEIFYTIKDIDRLVSVDTNTISWLRATYSKYLAVHEKKLYFIPNYVDLATNVPIQKSKNDVVNIIFPRRCCVERGFWLMAEALPELMSMYENIVFEFIGYVHSEDIGLEIQSLISHYPNRVKYRFVPAHEMYKVYQQADIAVIPTIYSEGTSLSCIEAMACGNAVIATNVGGLTNLIIDRYNGLLISPTKDALVDALKLLIDDSCLRTMLAENAIGVAKAFSKENWEERWESVISEGTTRSE